MNLPAQSLAPRIQMSGPCTLTLHSEKFLRGALCFAQGASTIATVPFDLTPWRAPGVKRLLYDSYHSLLFVEIKNATILHMFSCMHILLCR
jgi:hypothetical protein